MSEIFSAIVRRKKHWTVVKSGGDRHALSRFIAANSLLGATIIRTNGSQETEDALARLDQATPNE